MRHQQRFFNNDQDLYWARGLELPVEMVPSGTEYVPEMPLNERRKPSTTFLTRLRTLLPRLRNVTVCPSQVRQVFY